MEPLTTTGTSIIEARTGRPVLLRGINRSGLEYSSPDGNGSLAKAGVTAAEIEHIVRNWGANVLRLPFNQDWALTQPAYLQALDFVIATAARAGAYTLLDLQWLDALTPRGSLPNARPNFVPPLPNLASIAIWEQLADRYRDEPAVLYDIFNEPHDALEDDAVPLLGIDSGGATFALRSKLVTMDEWQPWALHLVAAIRSRNPNALVFISGVNWAYDLRGFPLPGLDRVVYSAHVYPAKGTHWDEAFGDLARTQPVFAAEWGGHEEDAAWGLALFRYMQALGIGWTAWSWADEPLLVYPGSFEPTPFGNLVRAALAT